MPFRRRAPVPAGVGLELPDPGSWLTLEVHYNNGAKIPDAHDRSGVAMCTPDTPRPNAAGVITLGSIAIAIPPDNQPHMVSSEIPGVLTGLLAPIHFGEKTENEMCFNFVAVYPIGKVTLREWIR